ncbi:MAG: hypothetical protein PHS93_07640 [Candidatus Omnitrophica bacterium]|nr:hypothetical protein [Candidatus Omnitrophota bacterium]
MKSLDVLCLTYHDWANSMYRYVKCLEYLGLNVQAYKGAPHNFDYPHQIAIHTGIIQGKAKSEVPAWTICTGLRQLAEEARVIHYFASTFIDTGIEMKDKKCIVQHGGTMYRMHPKECNDLFNGFADMAVCQYPTLLELGADNECWIPYPVDTEFIQPDYTRYGKDKLLIGHFPSNKDVKGTENINRVIDKLGCDPEYCNRFEYIGVRPGIYYPGELASWYINLKRLERCDIIIETCQPEYGGKPFGEWGNTALEAAALGKIVITNSIHSKLYKKEFGYSALHIANNESELESALKELFSLTDMDIQNRKEESRVWVEEKHSIPATAERLWDLVYKPLLGQS